MSAPRPLVTIPMNYATCFKEYAAILDELRVARRAGTVDPYLVERASVFSRYVADTARRTLVEVGQRHAIDAEKTQLEDYAITLEQFCTEYSAMLAKVEASRDDLVGRIAALQEEVVRLRQHMDEGDGWKR